MVNKARIKLASIDHRKLDEVCRKIKEIAKKTGAHIRGPIPLPTKKMKIVTRKTPCGEGTDTWDKWELRIHKRIIDIDAEQRTLRQIIRIQIPAEVKVEIELS